MKIGILSDTHDNGINTEKAIEVFNTNNVDLVIHCGDWVSPFMLKFFEKLNCKLYSIFGNNEVDTFRFENIAKTNSYNIDFFKSPHELELDNKKIVVYHGHIKEILNKLLESDFDVVLSGHTHKAIIETVNNTLHINPGTVCNIIDAQLQKNPTIAIYNTKNNKAEIIKLI